MDLSWSGMQAGAAGVTARMQQSALGRAFYAGTAESLGFEVHNGRVGSFLGLKDTFVDMGGDRQLKAFKQAKKFGQNPWRAAAKSTVRAANKVGVKGSAKWAARFAGRTTMKAIPLLSTAYFAYSGYQEGGVMGAIGGVGESILWSSGIRAVGAVTGPLMYGVAPLAAVGLATYALGEAGRGHRKSLRTLEMGGGKILDALGSAGAATSRQRSMMALNNTHLNGRMAMGNEALIMHTPFR